MQFADFVSVGFNQIVNNLAKMHYRWGQNADVVIECQQVVELEQVHFIVKVMKHGLQKCRD
jgi:pyruvate/2-oxoglutarate/acetoin dehydrogenase E1 component